MGSFFAEMVAACILLAEATSDPNVSMLGWVTAGTTAGLLGPVLYWLCYVHLPQKDGQIKELVAAKDKQIMELIAQHNEERSAVAKEKTNEQQTRVITAEIQARAMQEMINSFSEELKQERATCERRHAELLAKFEERHKEILATFLNTHNLVREVRHEVANMAQERANARAIEKAAEKTAHNRQPRGGTP